MPWEVSQVMLVSWANCLPFGRGHHPCLSRCSRDPDLCPVSGQIPGGTIEESQVLRGVLVNKDVTHPKMRRRIENPRILLLDCTLEYKKGESQVSDACTVTGEVLVHTER